MNKEDIHNGDILSWDCPEHGGRTIAVMADADYYHVAYNTELTDRCGLFYDNPADLDTRQNVRKATPDEFQTILLELIVGYRPFNRITVDFADRRIIPYGEDPGRKPDKVELYWDYLRDLVDLFLRTGKLRGMSTFRDTYHIGGITKEQFFAFGLHQMSSPLDVTADLAKSVYQKLSELKSKSRKQ